MRYLGLSAGSSAQPEELIEKVGVGRDQERSIVHGRLHGLAGGEPSPCRSEPGQTLGAMNLWKKGRPPPGGGGGRQTRFRLGGEEPGPAVRVLEGSPRPPQPTRRTVKANARDG